MGTDIHGLWQKKNRDTGKWEYIESRYEQNRHYQLFAVLAGVRNGFGFAGIPTGEAVVPISEPKGLPDDLERQDIYEEEEGYWRKDAALIEQKFLDPRRIRYGCYNTERVVYGFGDHSFSWLTGEEMLNYKLPTLTQIGIISREAYEEWDKESEPATYCGRIGGPGIRVKYLDYVHPTLDEIDKKDAVNDTCVEHLWTHIQVEWKRDLRDELGYFFDEVQRLVDEHSEIRFVFGFDS